jgi:hypothetical protein
VASWTFLTYHARVLLLVAHDPGVRLRDIAASLDITERRAFGITSDLVEAGYVVKEKNGRRNRYRRLAGRHKWCFQILEKCCLFSSASVAFSTRTGPQPPTAASYPGYRRSSCPRPVIIRPCSWRSRCRVPG